MCQPAIHMPPFCSWPAMTLPCCAVPCHAVCTCRPEPGSDTAAGRVPSGPWRLLGVDCEMCATSDNDKELLQVAVVDEDGSLLMQVGGGQAEGVTPPAVCVTCSVWHSSCNMFDRA